MYLLATYLLICLAVMNIIKLKCGQEKSQSLWSEIMRMLSSFDIRPYKLVPVTGGYLVYINDATDCDRFLSEPVIAALNTESCVPVVPPEIIAKRTVILHGIDNQVMEASVDELRQDLSERNMWIELDSVFKLKNGKSIKIVCKSHTAAARCLTEGVRISYTSIPPRNIVADRFVKVTYCFKCYALEDHIARDCPKPSDYKVCSLCSAMDHTFRDCTVDTKCCVNCNGEHSAISFACPLRRDIKKKILSTTVNKNVSYSSNSELYSATLKKSDASTINYGGNSDLTKSFMCIVMAGVSESREAGSFEGCLGDLLKANKLPAVKLGSFIPLSTNELLRDGLRGLVDSFSNLLKPDTIADPTPVISALSRPVLPTSSRRRSLIPYLVADRPPECSRTSSASSPSSTEALNRSSKKDANKDSGGDTSRASNRGSKRRGRGRRL